MSTIGRTPDSDNLAPSEQENPSFVTYARGYLRRLGSGDLGSLPIIIGLVFIAIIFQSQNSNFLTPRNFVNLILQMAGYAMIAYGVVFVLLLGEIDLSIGYVSAVCGVAIAMLLRDPAAGWSWYTAIPLALLAVAGIGLLQGLIITTFRVPSFIVTLAGLLAWNGVVLRIIGRGGTVIIQDSVVIGIANSYIPPDTVWGWVVAGVFVAGYALVQFAQYSNRRRQGLSTRPLAFLAAELIVLILVSVIVVAVVNQDRGLPVVGIILMIGLIVLTFIARSTQFGRYVYAVGGNQEAARRAGINVTRIRVIVFMMSSTLAGLGGIILASRLRSVDTGAGGGNLLLNAIAAAVIGGTSLFGGRGRVSSAVLGALIIASVENGMSLLNLASGDKFVITGIVLLVAVIVDSLSRRRQQQAGIA
ncbi:MAG: ABC transporter permease [Anaerolineae bacterium]|nr:ABC transporter permease [Anaerolineae bacterium]